MRALETGRMLLAATNSGVTATIGADGRVAAELPQFVEGKLETRVQGFTGVTPFVRFRDWPALGLCMLLLALALLLAPRSASG